MSVQTQIDRIESAKEAIATAIAGKGVTVPNGTLIDGMASLITAIESGGGGADISPFTQMVTGTITPASSTKTFTYPSGIEGLPAVLAIWTASDTTYSSEVPYAQAVACKFLYYSSGEATTVGINVYSSLSHVYDYPKMYETYATLAGSYYSGLKAGYTYNYMLLTIDQRITVIHDSSSGGSG